MSDADQIKTTDEDEAGDRARDIPEGDAAGDNARDLPDEDEAATEEAKQAEIQANLATDTAEPDPDPSLETGGEDEGKRGSKIGDLYTEVRSRVQYVVRDITQDGEAVELEPVGGGDTREVDVDTLNARYRHDGPQDRRPAGIRAPVGERLPGR